MMVVSAACSNSTVPTAPGAGRAVWCRYRISPDGKRMLLISLLDNLGKGSSGAAVQCMNIMLGLEETKGLEL